MYIKVFGHGKGRGEKAVRYLIRADYANRRETPPKILRSDPELTSELINSLPFAWKYTSGVMSWHPDDIVTAEAEQKLMDDFEKLAFAGLEKDQYHILWVRHAHAAHHELHFIIPRAELYHGKAFNAFPPGWKKDFDVLRDMYNVRYGWARPDDPKRQRICVPRQASLLQNRLKRLGQEIQASEKDKIHDLLVDYAQNAIAGGSVTDREELIAAFAELGLTINRKGRDYITVKYGGHKVRLKGGIFHESWRIGAENTGQAKSGETPAGRSSAAELGELQAKLEQILQKRFSYNRKRYAGTMQGKQITHSPNKKELLYLSDRDYSFVFFDNGRKQAGNLLHDKQNSEFGRRNSTFGVTKAASRENAVGIEDYGNSSAKHKWEKLHYFARTLVRRSRLGSWRQKSRKDIQINDGNSGISYQNRAGIGKAEQSRLAGAGSKNTEFAECRCRNSERFGRLESAFAKLDGACRQLVFFLRQPVRFMPKPKEIIRSKTNTIKKFFGLSR